MSDLKPTNSGISYLGNWDEIVLFSHVLAKFLEKSAPHQDAVEEYEEWMPKDPDDDKDMKEKTADEACIEETQVEKDFNGANEELKDAQNKLKDSVKDIANGENPAKDLGKAAKDIKRLVGAGSLKSLRILEKSIYKHIMLNFNPYYFDTEDFSVNLHKIAEEKYKLAINISDEDLKKKVQDRFKK